MTDETLPRLYERDIDVLLQEEILFNTSVQASLSNALGLPERIRPLDCRLSVYDTSGETDILATFALGDSRGAILIENKIDAAFQPRQPERYKERAEAFRRSANGFDLAFCVLVAPKDYLVEGNAQSAAFDAFVAYEDLAHAVASDGTPRAAHRSALLTRAIQQAKAAYILVPAPQVTSLWERVYNLATAEFPLLGMARPNEKGSNSNWIIFKADLPKRITVDWKLTRGTVDLSFWKGAVHVPRSDIDFQQFFGELGQIASLTMVGETTAIRLKVSKAPSDFSSIGDDTIREALAAAASLYRFYQEHPSIFI